MNLGNDGSVGCMTRSRKALAFSTGHHVSPQSTAPLPRQSKNANQRSNGTQRNNQGRKKSMELSDALKRDGYVLLDLLESPSIAKLRDSSRSIIGYFPRWKLLRWDPQCTKVKDEWEAKIKPKLEVLDGKKCFEPSLVEFLEMPSRSGTYRPEVAEGGYMGVIVIREGPGIPLLSKGSHLPETSIDPGLPVDLKNGESLVYDWRIGRQEPAFVGPGALVITLLYK